MPRRLLGPLGARLALAFILVAFVAIAVVASFAVVGARTEATDLAAQERDMQTAQIVAVLSQAYADAGGWNGADVAGAFALAAAAGAELIVLDADGAVVATAPASMDELMTRMHGHDGMVAEWDESVLARVEAAGAAVGSAQLRFPSTGSSAARDLRDAVTGTVGWSAGIAAAIALVAAVFVSRRVTRPLVALTDAAQRVGGGSRDARVAMADAPGELGELAAAFDGMAENLAREDRLRRTLVADVAHELRTPATILRASCEEMVDGLAEPTADRLASLHEEVLRLGRVIEDLEALASAQAASLHLECTALDLGEVVRSAADALRPLCDETGHRLTVTTEPAIVDGDATRLHQIVTNLLTNAIKFTPPGGDITVGVERDGALARLTVRDNGLGIPTDEIDHVFEHFWRGSRATSSSGSGIGLAIVAELAKAHGGTASVESAPGHGSTFTVLLPLR